METYGVGKKRIDSKLLLFRTSPVTSRSIKSSCANARYKRRQRRIKRRKTQQVFSSLAAETLVFISSITLVIHQRCICHRCQHQVRSALKTESSCRRNNFVLLIVAVRIPTSRSFCRLFGLQCFECKKPLSFARFGVSKAT